MYSTKNHFQTLQKLVLRPLQLMGIFPFSFDTRKRQLKKSNAWLALTITHIILLLTVLPVAYYHVLIYISNSGSQLSFLLVAVQLTVDYFFELSIYIKICYHLELLETTASNVLKLFFVLVKNVDRINEMVLKQLVNKIYFMNISFFITSIAYIPLVMVADNSGYQLTIFWILYSLSPYRLLTVINFFVCAITIETTLYDSINQRVIKSIERLRQLERNESYWTTHEAQKKALCRTVASEIAQLCRLHRIVTRTVHRTVKIFDTPIVLTILIEFLIIISEVFFFYTGIGNNLRRGVYPNYEKYALSFMYVMMLTASFYYTAASCYNLTNTAERTGVLLNEFIRADVEERVEISIEVFTYELLHHNYKVEMFGLFSLDFRLFYQIFATITNYLILLVQFQLTDQ